MSRFFLNKLKKYFIITMVSLVLITPVGSLWAAEILLDQEMDQVSAGAFSIDDLTKILNFLSSLSIDNQAQKQLITINNISAVNSVVVSQTNLSFANHTSGDITQSNYAVIIRK